MRLAKTLITKIDSTLFQNKSTFASLGLWFKIAIFKATSSIFTWEQTWEQKMLNPSQKMIQIRWHGRGGQGAITAAKVVAEATFKSGYAGVVMAPSFGTERRGAPVSTSLKISRSKIYDLSPIQTPDIVVVLDHLILNEVNVTAGLKAGGLLIINSPHPASTHQQTDFRVAVVNVTRLGEEAGLRKGIVNSGIIGALGKASGLVDIEMLTHCIVAEFQGRKPQENSKSAQLAYNATEICEPAQGGFHA